MSENIFGYETTEQFATDITSVIDLSHGVGEQNNRFGQVSAIIDDPEFASIAREGIKLEQARTIDDLRDLVEILPLDELGGAHAQLETEVAEIEEKLASAEAAIADDVAKIDANLHKTIDLAPLMEASARELAQRQKETLRQHYIDNRGSELETKRQRLTQLTGLFGLLSEAWPIPEAVNYYETESLVAERTIIDEIPLQPTLTGRQSEELQRLRTREVDAPEASQYIALLLSENRGTVVSVNDIVNYLYSPDIIAHRDDLNLRSRVTTMLGPKIQGKRIANMLLSDNLVLQYGFRRVLERDESGTAKMSAPTRIYRAVPFDKIDEYPAIVTEEHGLAQFDTTQLLVLPESAASEPDLPIPEILEPTATTPVENSSPKPVAASRHRPPTPSVRGGREQDWKSQFLKDVGEAINTLAGWNLMVEDDLTARQTGLLAQSTKFGTKEAVERLASAGVLGRTNARSMQDAILSPADRVAMYLQNSHPEVFTSKTRTKQAVKLITEALTSYYEHQKPKQ